MQLLLSALYLDINSLLTSRVQRRHNRDDENRFLSVLDPQASRPTFISRASRSPSFFTFAHAHCHQTHPLSSSSCKFENKMCAAESVHRQPPFGPRGPRPKILKIEVIFYSLQFSTIYLIFIQPVDPILHHIGVLN